MFDFIKKHKLAALFILLFFIATAMYSKNLKSKRNLNSFQMLILDITQPISNLFHDMTSFISDKVDHYFFLMDVEEENDLLNHELEHLQERIRELKEVEIANKRLRKLLDFKKTLKSEVVAAEVISRGASTWLNTIIIDKGKNDGVIPGSAVVTELGVIGHTIYTSNNYAQVLLVIDKNSAIDVLNQRSRAKGIVKGYRDNMCRLDYVLTKEDVLKGDVIITSGQDGIFPKGLYIGKVTEVSKTRHDLFQSAALEPFVNFDTLEEVLVIKKQEELLEEVKEIKENR
jgi:rod shape-determining protein MreC